jgi:tetratricopeptide (TPR) repeat protein
MAGPSRIDELRKKFDENPRRYFAPLANEYRKIGDFEQAIFICQEFLPQQPGHMSGHIVYGQALFESGRHDEARSVFETALALDPENLIALRHLGDIARALGDNETARAWYRRVLESDPRNEEIAGILSALDADVPPAAAGAASAGAAPTGDSQRSESFAGVAPQLADSGTPVRASDPVVGEPPMGAPAESNFDDIAKLFTTATPAPAPPTDDSLELIHEGEDVLGRAAYKTTSDESILNTPSADAAAGSANAPSGLDTFGTAAQNPPASFTSSFLDGLTSAQPPAPPPAAAEPPPPAPSRSAEASAAFVTETMAELYVQQGHHDQALEVYRKLVQLHPGDTAIAARLRELEAKSGQEPLAARGGQPSTPSVVTDAGPTIRDFLSPIAEYRPRSGGEPNERIPEPPRSSAAKDAPERRGTTSSREATVGGSLHSLFTDAERGTAAGGIAASRPADLAVAAPSKGNADREPTSLAGRPATPAATELSLDHVFRHATPAAGSATQSSFSFDQFFSQQAQQDVASSDAQPSSDASGGLSDDIQQFNAWLEGLKKT